MTLFSLIIEQSTVPCLIAIIYFLGDHFGVDKKKSGDHFGVDLGIISGLRIISGAVQYTVISNSIQNRKTRQNTSKTALAACSMLIRFRQEVTRV